MTNRKGNILLYPLSATDIEEELIRVMTQKEATHKECITEEMIKEYLTLHTFINQDGTVSKCKNKYFIKD